MVSRQEIGKVGGFHLLLVHFQEIIMSFLDRILGMNSLIFVCRLDLYLPKNGNGPKPVVAFITGGAWIIG